MYGPKTVVVPTAQVAPKPLTKEISVIAVEAKEMWQMAIALAGEYESTRVFPAAESEITCWALQIVGRTGTAAEGGLTAKVAVVVDVPANE